MTMKVFRPSNIFSINALLRNLALKHYSVQPNQYSYSIAFHSVTTTTIKLMAQSWVLNWDPAMPIFSQVLSNTNFLSQYHGPKPELYGRYIDDCIGATASTKEELTQFITAVNSFHPALKYTFTSLAFLDIKISILGNGTCTTDSHNYLLYSSLHPSHEKKFMPFSQFNQTSSFMQ